MATTSFISQTTVPQLVQLHGTKVPALHAIGGAHAQTRNQDQLLRRSKATSRFLAAAATTVVVGAIAVKGKSQAAKSAASSSRSHGGRAARVTCNSRGGEEVETAKAGEAEVAADSWGPTFVWRKAWYPMGVVEDMDPTRPTKLDLLGDELVAWKDGEGEWRVFEDRCPHRAVPLSEGRVESDGTLMCSYHGWRWDGEGKLTSLPQATDKELKAIQTKERSCAAVRPSQIRHGVLWVWGESGPDAALESALSEPNIVKEVEDPKLEGRASCSAWSHRDVPYGWEVAMENVTDPAHVAVSHHNVVANRYTDPKPLSLAFVRKPTNKGGFAFRTDPQATITDFKPPVQIHITEHGDKGAYLKLIINFVPTKPGWTRLVGTTLLVKDEDGKLPKGFGIYSAPLPRWLTHLLSPMFNHQDQVFLHYQQGILQKHRMKTGKGWESLYWMPTKSDKAVSAMRRWIDKNGSPDWSPGAKAREVEALMPFENEEELFDVWTTHSSKCTTCQTVHRRVSVAGAVMKYSAMTLGAAGIAGAGWPYLVGGAALGVGAAAANKLRRMFHTQPYNHQDNN